MAGFKIKEKIVKPKLISYATPSVVEEIVLPPEMGYENIKQFETNIKQNSTTHLT